MEYIISLFQFTLFILFLVTLKCELSKHYSDSIVFVSIRTFVMCTSTITFFMLFDNKYHNLLFVSLVFVPIILGLLYTIITIISSNNIKYQKGIYNDFSRR